MSGNFDLIVVGAGVTGLAAAFRASRSGQRVCLIEGEKPGGVVASSRIDDILIEHGPNVLLEKPALRRLIEDLGLAEEVVYPAIEPYDQLIWHRGRAWPVPKGLIPFIKTPLLTHKLGLIGKLLFGKFPKPEADDLSVHEFFLPVLREQGANVLLGTALRGVYGADSRELSARFVFPSFWEIASEADKIRSFPRRRKAKGGGGRGKIFTFKRGLASLLQALRFAVEGDVARISANAASLEPLAGEFIVRTADGRPFRAPSVIITGCGHETASLFSGIAPDFAAKLRAIPSIPLTMVHGWIERAALPKAFSRSFGILFSEGETSQLIGVMFNSILFPHIAPEGKVLLTSCLGGTEPLGWPNEKCFSAVQEELRATTRIENIKFMSVSRWEHAMPLYRVGHYRLAEEAKAIEQRHPGLYLAGRDVGAPGIADRIGVVQQLEDKGCFSKSAVTPASTALSANA